jgi:hypothetical protein
MCAVYAQMMRNLSSQVPPNFRVGFRPTRDFPRPVYGQPINVSGQIPHKTPRHFSSLITAEISTVA